MPAEVDLSVEQRIVEAAARSSAFGAVTGWAALRWRGATWFGGTGRRQEPLPVTVATGTTHSLRADSRLRVSREVIPLAALGRWRGIRLTQPLWSVAYEMRKAPDDEAAVVAFELAAFHDLVSTAELEEYVDSKLGTRQGVQRIRDLLPELEENSWSPAEPVMRLTWTGAGFARPLANRPVFNLEGRFVGTPDLVDPVAGVYGQYDGALHLAGEVRQQDIAKEAAYRRLGLEGVTMMAGDLGNRDPFVVRLAEAYRRAARRPADQRLWTVERPKWWIPTMTVDQRRALSAYDRQRLLKYRRAA
ncbi:hypothetical protein [Nocardioides terrigena]|uniref:hypothetical protein n=1 Tax=Nocardioides terrigena TaxID=424797 RepID=UPI000D3123E1|nr:hypothetical protein [Nocardioides terrigena]